MEHAIQVAAVFGTIGLLWLTLQALRRFRGVDRPGMRVQVRQRVTIANGCQLVVVEWDGRELLIATGNHPCTVVASKAQRPVAAPDPSPAPPPTQPRPSPFCASSLEALSEAQVHAEASGAWAH